MDVLSIAEGLVEQSAAARAKVVLARQPLRFLVAAMLAGAYVGVAVVLMLATAGPLFAAGNPAERLVAGGVFGVALTLVVFGGGELSTSAMMILVQGALRRAVGVGTAAATLVFSFAGNLLGGVAFGWLVVQAHLFTPGTGGHAMLQGLLAAKAHESFAQLFFRGVLCNVLVCVAIWACGRLRSESARAIVIFWALFAFVASGFEHVVANMTTFSLGLFTGGDLTTWADFGRNLAAVGLGNLVGGGLLVGAAYAVVGGARTGPAPAA